MAGDEQPEGLQNLAESKKPAVRGHQLEEFCGETADAGLVEDRGERLGLLVSGENRTADQPREVGAVVDHRAEAVEIGLHGIDFLLFERELEQRGCVTARYS